jgi:hypothetical protein
MSKKETRRAARQGQPKPVVRDRNSIRGSGAKKPQARARTRPANSLRGAVARQPLRPPTLKRAAIQGVIGAVLYMIVIRYLWKQPGTTAIRYVIFAAASFAIFTAIAYLMDRYNYQKRLRKQQGSSR